MRKMVAVSSAALVAAAGLASVTPNAVAADDTHDNARAEARAFISDNGRQVLASKRDAFRVVDTFTSASGSKHLRYVRTYDGLPVLGGDFVVHQNAQHEVTGATVNQDQRIAVSSTPGVSARTAISNARSAFRGARVSGVAGKPTLMVDARDGEPRLVWVTTVTGVQRDGQTPSRQVTVVDAKSGKVTDRAETVTTVAPVKPAGHQGSVTTTERAAAEGTGEGIFLKGVPLQTTEASGGFEMVDETRGGNSACDMGNSEYGNCSTLTDDDNAWGDGTMNDVNSAGVDAFFGANATFDYFLNNYQRNGIFDDGQGVPSRVHYGDNYVNAFWDGQQMTYGDGEGNQNPLVALDVAAHEMSHGVTEATAGLAYEGDAGGINEATSDIFGTAVEFEVNNPGDTPDFLIGENIDINGDGTPLRWMDEPSKDGVSLDCWSADTANEDPHYTSGVGNHFFFLLANGSGQSEYGNSPTCDGSTVTGIGIEDAAAIWYEALSGYMTSNETYADAREHTLQAAADLFGQDSQQYASVEAAWSAVAVN